MPDVPAAPRRGTTTSAFGVSKRESHDASAFYARFTAPELSSDATIAPAEARAIDEVFCHEAQRMPELADASVALVVTSPPYFAGKEYETALGEGHVPATYGAYLQMLEDVFAECVRVLEPGGRIAVNVANLGRRPYRSLAADVTWILQDRLRLLLRGEVVWVKARGATGSCAWGSFQRPANPVLRDLTERVVIAGKGRFDRALTAKQRAERGLPHEATISKDEFLEATTDVWELPTESAGRIGHPAPFPVDLPERLIHLYTYRGDLVLDPFMGSGSTAVAAARTGRHFAGYDTDPAYVELAHQRVAAERAAIAAGHSSAPSGASAKELARAALEAAGFRIEREDAAIGDGIVVSFCARDAAGDEWHVDVAGPATSGRSGLRRTDALWRVLGTAAVHEARHPKAPYLVLTSDVPPSGTPAAHALRAVVGEEGAIRDVVVLGDAEGAARLAALARG